jgi:ribosomal protein L11
MSPKIVISSQIHVKRTMNQKMDTITSHKGISSSLIHAWGAATGAGTPDRATIAKTSLARITRRR